MELALRPRVVWFVETCGHTEAGDVLGVAQLRRSWVPQAQET